MYLLTLILPILLFLISSFFGNFIGFKGLYLIGKNIIILLLIMSIILLKEILWDGNILTIKILNWFKIEEIKMDWIYVIDDLSLIMLIIVLSVSLIVYIYSYDYLIEDAHKIRFYNYINLFILCMIILITTPSLLFLFIGWEGVGISSFLLISFWFNRIETSLGGLLAFIMNRIGDTFYILGILMCYIIIGSIDIFTILSYPSINNDFIIIFFILASMAKSAQIYFHIWLPYSMEGPTPISALIHAATMVTAGIYLLLRLSLCISYSYFTLLMIIIIGSLTAFIGGTLAIISNDLKELVAYSTMSQLGYMITIIGLQSFSLSFYHLINHAYFKALLFLTAGSIIHSIFDIQDLRKLGSLINFIPISYLTLIIGFFNLTGLPFTTGFYSKESIINNSIYSNNLFFGEFIYWITLLSAFFTIYYSYSFILKVFFKITKFSLFNLKNLHYYSLHLTSSLLFLTFITIFFGYFTFKFIYLLNLPISFYNLQLPFYIKIIPILFFFIIFFIFNFFSTNKNISNNILQSYYYFSPFYKNISNFFLLLSYRIFIKLFDNGFIDLLGGTSHYNIIRNNKLINFNISIINKSYFFPLILFFIYTCLFLF
jgi:NADH-ubiquinone oxidoreductase chain 5